MPKLTKIPPVIGRIIAVTSACFLLQTLVLHFTSAPWVEQWGALILRTPDGLPWWQVWRLLSYALLHYDIAHLFFNMLGLWLIGSSLEEALGGKRLLTTYLLSIVCGGISALIFSVLGWGGHASIAALMGASAGTIGVLATYITLAPQSTIYLWLLAIIPVKAKYLGIGVLLWQIAGLLFNSGSNTSYSAHLGGIIGGIIMGIAIRQNWQAHILQRWHQAHRSWQRRHIKVVK